MGKSDLEGLYILKNPNLESMKVPANHMHFNVSKVEIKQNVRLNDWVLFDKEKLKETEIVVEGTTLLPAETVEEFHEMGKTRTIQAVGECMVDDKVVPCPTTTTTTTTPDPSALILSALLISSMGL